LAIAGVVACSSGGGGTVNGGSVAWPGSANGTNVLDADGVLFRFDAATGCMYSLSADIGPAGFCLTRDASATGGFASYGATHCPNPAGNPNCDTASFDVVLTANPAGSGCVAVLGSGGANAATSIALAVVANSGGFLVQTTATPGAYKTDSNGVIPVCAVP
jgi:hypothetical protein